MPSLRYVNQTAPFWDFVASMENQGSQHPFFNHPEPGSSDEEAGSWGSWGPWAPGRGRGGWHRGPMPHHPHRPGPPPPGHSGEHPPPPEYDPEASPDTMMGDVDEKRSATEKDAAEAGPSAPKDNEGEGREGCHRRSSSRCHGRGSFGGRGGFRGRHGPWGRHGPQGMGFPFMQIFGGLNQNPRGNAWPDFLREQIFGDDDTAKETGQTDFKPELDVFDTESAYIVHVSLPGAKKEDVGVNWDLEKSELSVAGVVYRPGDEELQKTLAMDGRKIGPFEAKVRLGSRANPAQVDDERITAKLEDGVLVIEVPKLDKDYVEIKKVDIE
jgi:HSP20 family protein